MMRKFLTERRSWLLYFLFAHLLFLFVAYLDAAIPFAPVLYIVFLSTLIFGIFLVARYHKETRFYKRLEDWDHDLDLSVIAAPESPFERIVEASIASQTEQLKRTSSENRIALEQEKDDLLAWIHEVKTPLTAMRLMIDRLDDASIKAALTYEWLRIHLLLDQQLHQKRLPFLENDIYIDQVDLEDLLFTEIKTLQSWCIQKGIGFDVELEITQVLSDAKWLAFILRQILTNAVKYSDPHAPDIVVRSYERKEQTSLSIQDFGRGIDPKDLPRIFEKAFTSTANHHDRGATGMGLYLARKSAEPLLIHIAAESELGKGTTFTLTFPRPNDINRMTRV